MRVEGSQPPVAGADYIRSVQALGQHLLVATNRSGLEIFTRKDDGFRLLGMADGCRLRIVRHWL